MGVLFAYVLSHSAQNTVELQNLVFVDAATVSSTTKILVNSLPVDGREADGAVGSKFKHASLSLHSHAGAWEREN